MKIVTRPPSIDEQINFVRGARHLVSDEKREVRMNIENHAMLMAIEENLLAVKLHIGCPGKRGQSCP
jgi:predicted oxidoreductase